MQGRVFQRYSSKQSLCKVLSISHVLHLLVSSQQVTNLVSLKATLFCLSLRLLVSHNLLWSDLGTTFECHCAPLLVDFDQVIPLPLTSGSTFEGMECTLLELRTVHTKLLIEVFQDQCSGP